VKLSRDQKLIETAGLAVLLHSCKINISQLTVVVYFCDFQRSSSERRMDTVIYTIESSHLI